MLMYDYNMWKDELKMYIYWLLHVTKQGRRIIAVLNQPSWR